MNLVLSTHNVGVSDAIEQHIQGHILKLEHFDHRVIDARVTLEHDHTKAPERQFKCSVRLSVRGPDLFAEDTEGDMYAAIDLVFKKLEQQLRKRHGKRKAFKHAGGAELKRQRQQAEL